VIHPAPKPEPRPKSKLHPISRIGEKKLKQLGRVPFSTITGPRKAVKKRNAGRKVREFARCFDSRARVQFIKSLPCVYCAALSPIIASVTGPSDNAHTAKEGMGRRGHFTTIVPLCRSHHRRYDEHRAPFDQQSVRDAVRSLAPKIEGLWRGHLVKGGR
jgi:hypothetical protein